MLKFSLLQNVHTKIDVIKLRVNFFFFCTIFLSIQTRRRTDNLGTEIKKLLICAFAEPRNLTGKINAYCLPMPTLPKAAIELLEMKWLKQNCA